MGLKRIASRLIARHGRTATLLRPNEGTTDAYGVYVPGADTSYSVKILPAKFATELTLVHSAYFDFADMRVLLSADGLNIEPQTTDKLNIDGTEFEVRKVSTLAPAGEVIFWEMQVRDV